MPILTLKDRVKSYEEISDYKFMSTIPKIIVINGRNFRKTTSLISKPFSEHFLELMCGTMIKLMSEIDGAKLIYSFSDRFIIAINNDIFEDQWYNGGIQKTVSASAAIATYEFNRLAREKKIELFGDPIFTAQAFNVPNITELCNSFVSFQQQCFHSSLTMALFYGLLNKYDIDSVKKTIVEKSPQEKSEILFNECGIDFNNFPLPFRRGIACYRAPKIINIGGDEKIKNKLTIDMELPLFTKDHDFLSSIFKSGHDIFRAKRDV